MRERERNRAIKGERKRKRRGLAGRDEENDTKSVTRKALSKVKSWNCMLQDSRIN